MSSQTLKTLVHLQNTNLPTQAFRFSFKVSLIMFQRRIKLLRVFNDMVPQVINDNIFILGWSILVKAELVTLLNTFPHADVYPVNFKCVYVYNYYGAFTKQKAGCFQLSN